MTSIMITALILGISLVFILIVLIGILIFFLVRSRSKRKEEDENNPIIGCIDYDNDPDIDLIL
ncbi:MAG: hypothetical protein ACMUIG_01810 [Thermoplasmatota archaeon]